MLFTSPRFLDWDLTISNTFWRCARINNSPNQPTHAKRMGKKTNEISSIRAKLLQREVIQAPQRGYVQFAVPDLDIYLRENAAEILERF